MNKQNRLEYATKVIFEDLKIPQIICVRAFWIYSTAKIIIYSSEELNDEQKEDIDVAITEIIAQFPEGFFEDEFIVLSTGKELNNDHLAFQKKIA